MKFQNSIKNKTDKMKNSNVTILLCILFFLVQSAKAQNYQISNLQTIDLNRAAGFADSEHNIAPIATKPNGGAYIQWASNTGFNNRNRCTATSTIYATEVDNAGQVLGSDITLGQSLPYGIAATATGFGYLLGDGDKLIFRTYDGSQTGSTTIMNHRAKVNCGHYTPYPEGGLPDPGLDFNNPNGSNRWAWDQPYLPEKGDIAFGNNEYSTAFGHSNNFAQSNGGTNDTHSGDAYITFDNTAGNAKLSHAQADHSSDRRIEHINGNTFVSVRLNDRLGFRLYKHVNGVLEGNDLLFTTKTDYTAQDGTMVSDTTYRHRYCASQDNNDPACDWQNLYGVGGDGGGTSFGILGDLHSIGDGTVALTYGIRPAQQAWNEFNQTEVIKNQLDFALINQSGTVTLRRILFEPDGQVGQGNYTVFQPYERLTWVKSAMIPGGYFIFFRTETSNGALTNPTYTQGIVRMIEVDQNGIILQGPVTVPASASFNRADEVEVLNNGTIAWTSTTGEQLKLHLIPADQATTPPGSAPVALPATNLSINSFTANWNSVPNITTYRIDVSTDNFNTFVRENAWVADTSFTINNLPPATNFQYRIRAFNSAGTSVNSNNITTQTLIATTVSPVDPSCPSTPNIPNQFGTTITSVQFKDSQGAVLLLSNTVDESDSYQDFTGDPNLVLSTKPGEVLTHHIISSHGTGQGQENTKIWIDFNRDGLFNETNELLFNQLIGSVEGQVTIPSTTPPSMYRMRIRKGWDFSNACHQNAFTQLEDYAIQIQANVQLSAKVFLQGPYNGALMNDLLRVNNLIPTTEPYTALSAFTHVNGGGETVAGSVLATTGDDAILDWVFVELRSKSAHSTVQHTRSALLQRDGDIVEVDGFSPLTFPVALADDYYVAIRHRNHLGIRTDTVIYLSGMSTSLDFTLASISTFGNNSRKDLGGGVLAMWGCNANYNNSIRASGPPAINDYSNVLNYLGTPSTIQTNVYVPQDFNMDGTVRVSGPPAINDYSRLLNILGTPTTIIHEQL